jgi:hypothetical protein
MIVSLLTAAVLCAVTAGSAALHLLPVLIGGPAASPASARWQSSTSSGLDPPRVGSGPGHGTPLCKLPGAGHPGRAEPAALPAAGPAARRGLVRAVRTAAGQARLPAAPGPPPAPGHLPGPGRATVTGPAFRALPLGRHRAPDPGAPRLRTPAHLPRRPPRVPAAFLACRHPRPRARPGTVTRCRSHPASGAGSSPV